jgi:hypothetical protein
MIFCDVFVSIECVPYPFAKRLAHHIYLFFLSTSRHLTNLLKGWSDLVLRIDGYRCLVHPYPPAFPRRTKCWTAHPSNRRRQRFDHPPSSQEGFFDADQIDVYGEIHGLRDPGQLEAALFRPQSGCYADVIAEAATLFEAYENHTLTFDRLDIWLRNNTTTIDTED